jgi:CHAD domain-containing protein
MSPDRRSDRLIARRLQALARALPGAVEGDVAGVHKARVASRRIREALPVVFADAPPRRSRKLVGAFRRVTRALGPVRELDVTLALAAGLQSAHPAHAEGLELLRQDLETERQLRRQRMLATLEGLDLDRHVEKVERALRPRTDRREGHAAATALAARLARRGRSLRDAVDAAGAMYAAHAVHGVRIAVKKLRYALELAIDLKLLSTRRPLAQLKSVQETLGQLHDREVLLDRLHGLQVRLPAGTSQTSDLAAVSALLETECRELHAAYVARRDRLAGIADTALAALAPPRADPTATAVASVH